MIRGKFITLEGGEGSGKSTQAKRLAANLQAKGIECVLTREVGGSIGAEAIRKLWLEPEEGFWDHVTELLLIMAARREHLVQTVWPALNRGAWVVSDRFVDSTRAYQGIGLRLGVDHVDRLYREIAGDFWPDLTLFLDIPVDIGFARVSKRPDNTDRYEEKGTRFHEALRSAFLTFAHDDQKRFRVISAENPLETVAADVASSVESFFDFKALGFS